MALSKRTRKQLVWFSKQHSPATPDDSQSESTEKLLSDGYIEPVYADIDYDDDLFLERGRAPIGYLITESGRGYLVESSTRRANISLCLSILAIVISVLANLSEITASVNWVISSVSGILH